MANTDSADNSPAKRKTVSKREFIDDGGVVVKSMEEASGARYTILGDDKAPIKTFERLFGEAGKGDTMFAIMGFHTKIGNVINTVLNDKDSPGTPEEAADEAADFIALVDEGKWSEGRGGGGGFQKVDRDALTAAIVWYASEHKQRQLDPVNVLQSLNDNPATIGAWRKVPEVLADYTKRVGSKTVDVDSLMGKFASEQPQTQASAPAAPTA